MKIKSHHGGNLTGLKDKRMTIAERVSIANDASVFVHRKESYSIAQIRKVIRVAISDQKFIRHEGRDVDAQNLAWTKAEVELVTEASTKVAASIRKRVDQVSDRVQERFAEMDRISSGNRTNG